MSNDKSEFAPGKGLPPPPSFKTDSDRLRFAVRFAEEKLDHYRPGDWLNLRDNLSDYFASVAVGGIRIMAAEGSTMAAAKALSEVQIREIQEQVAAFLKSLATEKTREMDVAVDGVSVKGTATYWKTRDISIQAKWTFEAGWVTAKAATLREALLLRLILLVAGQGQEHIKACPECGRLFWKVRRQLYCSRTCVNRVNMRTWKGTRKGKAWRRRQTKRTTGKRRTRRTR